MTSSAPQEIAPKHTGGVLSIEEMRINENAVSPSKPVFHWFDDIMEAIAAEFIDGKLTEPQDLHCQPGLLVLELDLAEEIGNDWAIWAEECKDGQFAPELSWLEDKDGNRSDVYNAIEYHIRPLLYEMEAIDWIGIDAFATIRVNLQGISNHNRLRLAETRTKLVQAYAQSLFTPQAS